jgi:hypothetical protein
MTPLNGVDFEAIAREIVEDRHGLSAPLLIKDFAGQLRLAYERGVTETEKRLLLSRVQMPERKTPADLEDYNAHLFNACLDAIKLVPMNLPSDEEIHAEMVKLVKRKDDEGSWFCAIWGAGFALGAEWLRARTQAALGEKKDGE